MLPGLLIGVGVFVFILLMFQALRLTEFVLIHGVSLGDMGRIVLYLTISFLPAILPMSLLFSVLMTYLRLSHDSELLAMRSLGVSPFSQTAPALVLGFLIATLSAQTTFRMAPWGNRQFEILVNEISQSKSTAALREGTFSEGFFDLVIYAGKVDTKTNTLYQIFIYDSSSGDLPVTILAEKGKLMQSSTTSSQFAELQLENGTIHRKGANHTKIHFQEYTIRLKDKVHIQGRDQSVQSLTLSDLKTKLSGELSKEDRNLYETETHKRVALAFACLVFALLGASLGMELNRRNQRSSGFILSIGVIIIYWISYIAGESASRNGSVSPMIAVWAPNFVFLSFAIFRWFKAAKI